MTDDELRDWAEDAAAEFRERARTAPIPADVYFPTAAELANKRGRAASNVDDVADQEESS